MNNNLKAIILALVASVSGVTMNVLIKFSLQDINVFTAGFLRVLFGFILIIPFIVFGQERVHICDLNKYSSGGSYQEKLTVNPPFHVHYQKLCKNYTIYLDVGFERTSMFIFKNNKFQFFNSVSLGGNNITKDIKALTIFFTFIKIKKYQSCKYDYYYSNIII